MLDEAVVCATPEPAQRPLTTAKNARTVIIGYCDYLGTIHKV